MKVRRSRRADRDIEAIGDWIAIDNPVRAMSFVGELEAACERIGEHPLAYPLLTGSGSMRKGSFCPYLILYRVHRGTVVIVSIRHGARDNRRRR